MELVVKLGSLPQKRVPLELRSEGARSPALGGAVERGRGFRERQRGVGDRIGHLLEYNEVDVVDGVARLVVARVKRRARGTAEDGSLLGGLRILRAGEQSTGREYRC